MKHNPRLLFAVAALSLAALACNAIAGGGVPTVPAFDIPTVEIPTVIVELPTPADEPQGNPGDVLFQDDFTPGRGEWGTGSDENRTVDYVNDQLHMNITAENFFVWTTPNDNEYSNVHMEVTVLNNSTDPTAAFGIMCHQQFMDESFYYFAVTSAGEYAIVRAALAQDDVFLTNGGTWGESDLIASNAASYRIGADCGNGTLTLYVDGQQIDSVSDSTYTSGRFAVFAWSGDAVGTDVSFDDFLMTQLP